MTADVSVALPHQLEILVIDTCGTALWNQSSRRGRLVTERMLVSHSVLSRGSGCGTRSLTSSAIMITSFGLSRVSTDKGADQELTANARPIDRLAVGRPTVSATLISASA